MQGVSQRELTRIVLLLVALLIGLPAQGLAQRRGGDGLQGRFRGEGVSPAEIQRLFDAYVVMQAQEAVGVSEDQYPRFLTRLKALQDVRRRGQIERARILLELRRLARGPEPSGDEAAIRAQLKALDEADARSSSEEKMALEALDQVMDTTQQARFRLFEEQMERRKVELMMRARQSAIRPRERF
jgi:hypothetical protein